LQDSKIDKATKSWLTELNLSLFVSSTKKSEVLSPKVC